METERSPIFLRAQVLEIFPTDGRGVLKKSPQEPWKPNAPPYFYVRKYWWGGVAMKYLAERTVMETSSRLKSSEWRENVRRQLLDSGARVEVLASGATRVTSQFSDQFTVADLAFFSEKDLNQFMHRNHVRRSRHG
jgi:glutathione S-transferase